MILEEIDLPDFIACSLGVFLEILIPLPEVLRYGSFHLHFRLIVRIMDNSSLHTAKHSFNDIEKLGTGRQRNKFDDRPNPRFLRLCVK
jgi:hypothetical protein